MKNNNQYNTNNTKIKSLAYKVLYEDNLFKFGLGECVDSDEVEIKAEFDLTVEEFKVYFSSILAAIVKFSSETGRNLIEEISEDDD